MTSTKSGGAKFYQRKSGIVDKIKADFNVGKKDRSAGSPRLAPVPTTADRGLPTAQVYSSRARCLCTRPNRLGRVLEQAERRNHFDVRFEPTRRVAFPAVLPAKSTAGSTVVTCPGRSSPISLQQESLAESFEAMTLFEEALIQYDELEASFFQNLKGILRLTVAPVH